MLKNEVSPVGAQFYVAERLYASHSLNSMAHATLITGPLDVARLERALHQVATEYPALRTVFATRGTEIESVVATDPSDDLLEVIEAPADAATLAELIEDATQTLSAEQRPWKAILIRHELQLQTLVFIAQRCIWDEASTETFGPVLSRAYARLGNADSSCERPYAHANPVLTHTPVDNGTGARYFAETLDGTPPVHGFPLKNGRRRHALGTTESVIATWNEALSARLDSLSSELSIPAFDIKVAALAYVLAQYCGHHKVSIGLPFDQRPYTGSLAQLGNHTAVLPLGLETEQPHFEALCTHVHERYRKGMPFCRTQLTDIIATEKLRSDPTANPLFQAACVDGRSLELSIDSCTCVPRSVSAPPQQVDLFFTCLPNGIRLDYAVELISSEMAAHFARSIEAFLASVVDHFQTPLSSAPWISSQSQARVVTELNRTTKTSYLEVDLYDLIHRGFEVDRDGTALVCNGQSLTYGQLEDAIERAAHSLLESGAEPGDLIGISLPRDANMVVAVVATLRIGCAYVPLDPAFPQSRLEYMVNHSELSRVIADRPLDYVNDSVRIVRLDKPELSSHAAPPPRASVAEDAPAYVIYTSGSTGLPKGVVVPRNAVANFLLSMLEQPGLHANDRICAVTTLSFDISVLELLAPLCVGATVVLATDNETRDPRLLSQLLDTQRATVLQATPATWQLLCSAGWKGNPALKALCGGEALRPALASDLLGRVGELWNMYGPTETTVWSACKRITRADEPVSVGRPIHNTSIYVLDRHLRAVPQCVEGDVFIAGSGVTSGYLNNEELTHQRFVQDPFKGGVMYNTGDRGRLNLTGELEILGRSDFQVKIRGFRIELGEIETALSHLKGIHEIACVAQDTGTTQQLVAYYSVRKGAALDAAAVRKHCETSLPRHMIPSRFQQLDALPKTPNGKIDRNSLLLIDAPSEAVDGRKGPPPRGEMERLILEVFEHVLKVPSAGVDDSFFEIGGTSLTAFSVAQELESRTGIELSILSLFEHPTASSLAAHLNGNSEAKVLVDDTIRRAKFRRKLLDYKTDVAIIGAAGRFPGALTLREFWDNLAQGKETVTFFDRAELDPLVPAHDREDEAYVAARGVLQDIQMFDAAFFGITPNEAELMDPQLRVFMEVAWEAFEDAGYVGEDVEGLVGVWGGMGNNFYYHYNVLTRADKLAVMGEIAAEIANEKDHIAPRVSHKLNLTGPSLSVHAACSTGLVAVENAYQSLITHQVDVALAGAVDIRTPQKSGQRYEDGGVFSIDGHCRPFDADATGTMFGEGVGIVVLKRLEDALRDGDAIRAVIKGAATNHDGGNKGSYLSPSVEGQARVIATAMAIGDVNADTISFMEAHGTATPIGDPIEVEALTRVYRAQTDRKNYCALGSVKGNFGHATTAAGIAGLLKLTMSLENRKIPATLHFKNPNPRINFEDSPFFVNSELIDWVCPEHAPRRGSTSSFGFCGSNAHVVLEEAPSREPSGAPSRPAQLLLVSAKNTEALKTGAGRLGAALAGLTANELADAAYTTHVGRKRFDHRRCAVVSEAAEAAEILAQTMGPRSTSVVSGAKQPPLAFMFPGQGSQYINMGLTLYKGEPVFRDAIDTCASLLLPHLGCDLREFLFPRDGDQKRATQSLNNTFYTQPAIFTISYALATQLMHWGLKPNAFIGHSIGEFVAATLAEVMRLPDALRLVATRGRLMRSLPEGSMLSVRLAAEDVQGDLPHGVDLAAANSPQLCVVAGPTEILQRYAGHLEEQGVKCRMLHTSHAFHSSMMDSIVEPFEEVVRGIPLAAPKTPFVSTVTGRWMTDEEATDPSYWARHLRAPVHFENAARTLVEDPEHVLIECGPRRTLTTLVLQQRPKKPARVFGTMPDSAETADEYPSLLLALGSSWANGCDIDWAHFHEGERRLRCSLPTYAFQRKRFWIEPGTFSLPQATSAPDVVRPVVSEYDEHDLSAHGHAVKDPLMQTVVQLLEESLGGEIEDFDADAPFIALGLDSLLLTQLARTLRVKLGFQVTFRQLTEHYSTPRLLVDAINAQRPASAESTPSIAESTPSINEERETRAQASQPKQPTENSAASPTPSQPKVRVELTSTPGQLEMWLTENANPEASCAFNEAFQIELRGIVHEEALLRALRALPDRHPSLRGVFSADGERFILQPSVDIEIARHDFTRLSPVEQKSEVQRIAALDSGTAYDLTQGPLFRASSIRLGPDGYVVLLGAHHSACDGWSLDVLLADLGRLYRGFLEDQPPAPPAHSFEHYVNYRSTPDFMEQIERSRRFWAQTLTPIPDPLRLPHDGRRPARRSFGARHCLHRAKHDTHRLIRDFAKAKGLSFFSVLMAGYVTLLHRLSGATDIVVGTPVAGHPETGMEDCVGHLASMVPLRCTVDPILSFEQVCRQVNAALLDAREHASVGFGEIIAQIGGSRDPSRVPLVAAVITHVQRYREDQLDFNGCAVEYHLSPRSAEVFELNLNIIEAAGALEFKGHVNADLYSEQWLSWRLRELEHLLREACAGADRTLDELPVMPPEELEFVNQLVNPEPVPLAPHETLTSLLERQARHTPDAVAVRQEADVVTYAELHRDADRLAQLLRERGAQRGALVGICVDRTIDMVRAVLAVLKSGAAYVPLDPAFPQNRIAYMIGHAGMNLIISERALRDVHQHPLSDVLELEDIADLPSAPLDNEPSTDDKSARTDDTAYVLYTSGSTGKPKGVAVPHRAAVNFLMSMRTVPGLAQDDRLLAVTTLSFDISVLELLLPLSVGAQVVLATKEQTLDGQALTRIISDERISIMQATPVTWRLLIEAGWQGSSRFKALCGGEAMPSDLARALLQRTGELWNMYGPTETTVWSTCCRVTDASAITVGTPIANTVVRVLDAQMRPCPIGVPGGIYIGGEGLSQGYIHQPELTNDRFIDDPIATTPNARIYKTGDLGRWHVDKQLECLGRDDDQVKLRGFRIELGEVASAMATHADVQEAAAMLQPLGDDFQLVGYVVLKPGVDSLPEDMNQHLSAFLPKYMSPTAFAILPRLPQTANGKLDRKALPAPDAPSAFTGHATDQTSRNDVEAKVREVFVNHLRFPSLGMHDDFFEVGGHSLLAVRAVNELNEAFGTDISVATLFETPTVEGLAKAIAAHDGKLSDAVIQIHSAGNADTTPFFFVCGIALYQPLALNLGSRFSSYGIYIPQEEAFFENHATEASLPVQELATLYAKAIRQHPAVAQKRCMLGGISFGGLLAFEVARQLQADGDFDVTGLVLLDTVLPTAMTRNLRTTLAYHIGQTRKGGFGYLSNRIRRRFVKDHPAPPPETTERVANAMRLAEVMNGPATRNYLATNPRFNGDTLIVRAMDRSSLVGLNVAADLGWGPHLQGSVTVVDAPGDHLGILRYEATASQILNHYGKAMAPRATVDLPSGAAVLPSNVTFHQGDTAMRRRERHHSTEQIDVGGVEAQGGGGH